MVWSESSAGPDSIFLFEKPYTHSVARSGSSSLGSVNGGNNVMAMRSYRVYVVATNIIRSSDLYKVRSLSHQLYFTSSLSQLHDTSTITFHNNYSS